MLILEILILGAVYLIFRLFLNNENRTWGIYLISLITIYWFQPLSTIRNLDFWIPTFTILLAIIIWCIVYGWKSLFGGSNKNALIISLSVPFIIVLAQIFFPKVINYFSTGPQISSFLGIFLLSIFFIGLFSYLNWKANEKSILIFAALIGILIIQKNTHTALAFSRFLRKINGQTSKLANASDIIWVGFSYLAFRMIHVLKERDRIKKLNLNFIVFINYLVYSPAYIAGPIDTIFHFAKELEKNKNEHIFEDFLEGGKRIARGLFMKFILADSFALFSIDEKFVSKVNNPIWMWVMLFAYAFRLYFDFAGYSDIAIGISRLIGIYLPENFLLPYRSTNITMFWNRWHITLSQWFRTYLYNPLTRFLRTKHNEIPSWLIILFSQLSTMILIGMWHGINWNFLIWGTWNAVGMFVHNRWVNFQKTKQLLTKSNTKPHMITQYLTTAITFVYISLGWVWFALNNVDSSLSVFKTLFFFGLMNNGK